MSAELEAFERAVARAFTSPDPVAALEAASHDPALPDELRAALASADPDGVGMSSILIVRLRFERLIHGSRMANEWFERDPADFARAFKRYHTSVKPTANTPSGEARLFEAFSDQA